MPTIRLKLALLVGLAGLGAGCELLEPNQPTQPAPEPAETVTESAGETDVMVTPIEPEPELPKAPPDAPVSPREGVHETGEETRGRLAPAKIAPVLAAHSQAFTDCYATESQADPSLRGRVALLIVIAPDGSVPNAQIVAERTTLTHPKVHECLIREAKTLAFEKPVGGRVVTEYPLEFKPVPPPTDPAPAE